MTEQEIARAANPAYRERLEAEAAKLTERRFTLIAGGYEASAATIGRRLAEIDRELERSREAFEIGNIIEGSLGGLA